MRVFVATAVAIGILLTTEVPTALASSVVYSVHGSGTTNPSKCFWLLMSQMTDRARIPLHMTYRSVGSLTGITEIIGANRTGNLSYVPFSDFACGDVPVPSDEYKKLNDQFAASTNNASQLIHLPFVLSGISMFHSIPDVSNLTLTSCLLARILQREITEWDHEDILNKNPGLQGKLPTPGYPITVAVRDPGSSSTAGVTEYLSQACPNEWLLDAGITITWPNGTKECVGSDGMTACVRDFPGTIGYIDSGHGLDEGLKDIALENVDGNVLTYTTASANGGVAAAAEDLPDSASDDFGAVSFVNKPGFYTWPIVLMSYVYVRTNITNFMNDTVEQGLLRSFLESLYDPAAIGQCSVFSFTPVANEAREIGLAGLKLINFSPNAPNFTVESNITAGIGQGEYVFSKKRRSYSEYVATDAVADIAKLNKMMVDANGQVTELSGNSETFATQRTFTDEDQKQIKAALVLGSLSMAFWGLALGFIVVKFCLTI